MVICLLSVAVVKCAADESALMTTVSLRRFLTVPRFWSEKLSAAPWTVTCAFADKTTDAFPTALVPMVIVWVVSDPPMEPTVTAPIVPLLLRLTVALSKDKAVTECGILTSMLGSSKRVNKKPLVVGAEVLADKTLAGRKDQSLTDPGKLAVVPEFDTAILTSTVIVLLSKAPCSSVTLTSRCQLPTGSAAMAAAPDWVKPISPVVELMVK